MAFPRFSAFIYRYFVFCVESLLPAAVAATVLRFFAFLKMEAVVTFNRHPAGLATPWTSVVETRPHTTESRRMLVFRYWFKQTPQTALSNTPEYYMYTSHILPCCGWKSSSPSEVSRFLV